MMPQLRLIRGMDRNRTTFGGIVIAAEPYRRPPFQVDAVVAEEDSYMVLSAGPQFHETTDHPVRILTAAFTARPVQPGSVVVKHGFPAMIYAIVHDLGREPTWKEEWISSAFRAIVREAAGHGFQSVALPMLGTVHGTLLPRRSALLLRRVLEKNPPVTLKRLWLIVPDYNACEFLDVF